MSATSKSTQEQLLEAFTNILQSHEGKVGVSQLAAQIAPLLEQAGFRNATDQSNNESIAFVSGVAVGIGATTYVEAAYGTTSKVAGRAIANGFGRTQETGEVPSNVVDINKYN